MPTHTPVRAFVSYSRDDMSLRKELRTHLSALSRQGLLVAWDDGEIQPGSAWNEEIWKQLELADLVLLLVSASFMASDFAQREMDRALERRRTEGLAVVPILVQPCDYRGSPLEGIQMLPQGVKAVTTWSHRDEAWTAVVKGLRPIIEGLARRPKRATPVSH